MICSEHTALVKRHNRFEFFRKVAGRQRWFGGAEGHAIMISVTVKSYSIDHDLLEANSREEGCDACPLGRRRRGQGGAVQGERSLHWALGGSSGLKSTTPPKSDRQPLRARLFGGRRGRTCAITASAAPANSTSSITVFSAPSKAHHRLAFRTPFSLFSSRL